MRNFLFVGVPRQKSTVLAVPALGAKALILDIIHRVDGDLRALKDELAVDLAAVADGLAPAGADGLHLLDGVSQLQKPGGAGEALEGEVGAQAVADDGDVQLYRHHEQLLGLLCGEELALVAVFSMEGATLCRKLCIPIGLSVET